MGSDEPPNPITFEVIPQSEVVNELTSKIKKERIDDKKENMIATIENQFKAVKLIDGEAHIDTTKETVLDEIKDDIKPINISTDNIEYLHTQYRDNPNETILPTYRKQYLQEIINEKTERKAKEKIERKENIVKTTAADQISEVFTKEGQPTRFSFAKTDEGDILPTPQVDQKDVYTTDIDVIIESCIPDLPDLFLSDGYADIAIPSSGSEIIVDSIHNTQTISVTSNVFIKINTKSIKDVCIEDSLFEVETLHPNEISDPKEATNIRLTRGSHQDRPHIIELVDNDYAVDGTRTNILYKDYNPDKNMAVIKIVQEELGNNDTTTNHIEKSWLVGKDEGQGWAHQVKSECRTVNEALQYMTPRTVWRYKMSDTKVIRKGDVFFIRMKSEDFHTDVSQTAFSIESGGAMGLDITHPRYKDMTLMGNWKVMIGNTGEETNSLHTQHNSAHQQIKRSIEDNT